MSAPGSLDPDPIVSPRPRHARFVDRYETGVALLVAMWTTAFLVRSRLAQSDRLTDLADEALLSLLFVVPIMLAGWAALAVADRWIKFGVLAIVADSSGHLCRDVVDAASARGVDYQAE